MNAPRIFNSSDFFQPADGEPVRSVITESNDAVIVAWYIKPGQEIRAHVHPHGQDAWTILSGTGEYYLDSDRTTRTIKPGDVLVAHTGEVHGVLNNGALPLKFVSVVSPPDAGYQLVS